MDGVDGSPQGQCTADAVSKSAKPDAKLAKSTSVAAGCPSGPLAAIATKWIWIHLSAAYCKHSGGQAFAS